MLLPRLCLYLQKDSQQDVGHSSDLDQKRSGISTYKFWTTSRRMRQMMIRSRESGTPRFSEPRVQKPEECSRAKVVKINDTLLRRLGNDLKLFCAQLFSVNQLSIYGAVSDLCEEYSTLSNKNGEARIGRTI